MKILIGADLVPTKSNQELFAKGDLDTLLGTELQELLSEADYRIFNLEVPLTDIESPIAKNGPNLIAPKNAITAYKAIQADILTLANNHILDQGEQGMRSTCEVLDQAGISWLGVGNTPSEAAKPYIFEDNGKKIGIYACAEHEFSIVTDYTAGANPFDPLESLDHVMALKIQCDYVIVLYHGGKEHYRYPSPNLQKICRKLVEKGADLVICQHSHCIGCEEKYLNGTIVYGQGNFLFDHSKSEYWTTSLLIQVSDNFEISYVPLVKCDNTVRLAMESDADKILDAFARRSEEIKVPKFVDKHYSEYAYKLRNMYFQKISGKFGNSFLGKAINRVTCNKFYQLLYGNKDLLKIENILECEAHRELFIDALKSMFLLNKG